MSNDAALGGQHLIIGVPGPDLDAETRRAVEEIQPGGFILFGRNIKSPTQLRTLIDDLRAAVAHEPVVTIDQEGGRVSRLKEIGAEPPSAVQLRNKVAAGGDLALIAEHGRLTGRLLRLFGFNLDLCPVLDVSFDDNADNSLKNRTYGRDPEEVVRCAGAFNQALRAEGILSCGKHFPGYSAAAVDPHHDLPEIPRTRAELEACEWIPYRQMQAELDSLMIGHVRNRHLDPAGTASSLSRPMIDGIIRRDWSYGGLVMTDDMDMGAILNEYGFDDAMRLSIEAGNDMILLCHRVEMARQAAAVLAKLPHEVAAPARARIAALRERLRRDAAPHPFSIEAHAKLDAEVYALREAVLGSEAAKSRSADDGKRSPVETY
ncbi:MAG TPA: glycoside hydrolase family 3 N-terminal domain-containing protein [Candidatus Methylacidiphilales bacterium]